MDRQRPDQWSIDRDIETRRYHLSQWENPYRSTTAFSEFAAPWLKNSRQVVDLGCGAGAATYFLSTKFSKTRFIGLDFSTELISVANQMATEKTAPNISFAFDDMQELKPRKEVDGVISLQTLSWLPNFENPIEQICSKLNPKWMAFSSLFYKGDISCKIEVSEPKRPRMTFYNVYAVPRVQEFLAERGYSLARYEPFEIDIDLPRPDDPDFMRTYTVLPHAGARLQISGPLLMNWGFLVFEKK